MVSNRLVLKAVCASFLALNVSCQITLDTVPTDACIGHPVATATINTVTSIATDKSVYFTPGPAWKQSGATWKWVLGSRDLIWSGVGIPGAGAGFGDSGTPDSVNDALKISPDNKTILFSVPPSQGTENTVIAGITVAPGGSTFVRSTRPTIVPRADDAKVAVALLGATPCAGPTITSSTGPTDPAIASLCSKSKITPGTAAFSTYEVSSYMSSLLNTALPPRAPGGPRTLDAGSLIQSEVGPAASPRCTYTKQCQNIQCNNVKDYDDGTILPVQKYLTYQTVVNFNNYLYSLHEALYNSAVVAGLMSTEIVDTFFANPKPDVTWQQIIGIVAPLLAFVQSALGPIGAVSSAAAGVASSLLFTAQGAGSIADISAVADQRFDILGDVNAYVGQFLQKAVGTIEHTWNENLGPNTNPGSWIGYELLQDTGLFGDGAFSDNDFTQSLTNDTQNSMARVFSYKSINFALKNSGNFVMYVPYGVSVKGTNGKTIEEGINKQYCRDELKNTDEMGSITICDAPGGMARIFNAGKGQGSAGDASEFLKSRPQGWDSKLQTVPGETFDMGAAIKGSIASWRAGDFDYDVGDPFKDSVYNGKKLDIGALQDLKISQDSAGLFNIPVCQVRDLRAYPPASGYGCTACDEDAAVGGTDGSTEKFWDHISEDMQILIRSGPNQQSCGGIFCDVPEICKFDRFNG